MKLKDLLKESNYKSKKDLSNLKLKHTDEYEERGETGKIPMMIHSFDVYDGSKKIGTAETDDYFGGIIVNINNRVFDLDAIYDKNHPLVKQANKYTN